MYSPDATAAGDFNGTILDVARQRSSGDLRFFGRMVGAIRQWKPDVVHTHVHNGKYWGRLAAIVAGVRTIVHTEHNSDFRAPAAVRVANRLLHSRTARIIAFSPEHARRITSAEGVEPAKLVVIPNGIAMANARRSREELRRSLGVEDGLNLILHVGRFERVKNQALAVEAFAASEQLRSRASLAFVGNGVDESATRQLAASHGLNGAVHFLGYRTDVRDLLAAADAVALTSLNEAMPLVAIEAMMAGVPIVSVPWDGSAEFFEAGRLAALSPGYAPAAFARSLEETLAHSAAAGVRATRARELAAAQYSLDACVRRHAELYRSLVAQAGKRRAR